MLTHRRAAVTLLAVGVLALGSACSGEPERAPTPGAPMVALGDSAASGAGIAPSSERCARSERNYPSLVAEAMDVDLDDVTCGGATTSTVLRGSDDDEGMERTPQIDAVGPNTDLVTLTIGANDGDAAAAYFTGCFFPPTNTADACAQAVDFSLDALPEARAGVVDTIEEVRERAPDARIVLVGYLPLTPPTGCPTTPIAPDAVAGLAGYEGQLDRALQAAADDAGVPFVSVRDAAQGHDSCSSDPWVNGLEPVEGDGAFLHPTAAGAEAVADSVQALLEDDER